MSRVRPVAPPVRVWTGGSRQDSDTFGSRTYLQGPQVAFPSAGTLCGLGGQTLPMKGLTEEASCPLSLSFKPSLSQALQTGRMQKPSCAVS